MATTNSYKVTLSKGVEEGIGASVSGKGAKARVQGSATVKARHLDSSTKYKALQSKYDFRKGTSGFWSWLVGSGSEHVSKEEKEEVFTQVVNTQEINATFRYDLTVEGYAPNVQVDARAYYFYFMITDDQGNTYHIVSDGDPGGDTGAVNADDPSGKGDQPGVSNNNTTITV